jgi:hypothetical protein
MRKAPVEMRAFPPLARLLSQVTVINKILNETWMLVKLFLYWYIQLFPIISSVYIIPGDTVVKRV